MNVPFTKASACGNDFLIIQARYAPADLHAFTRTICDRHNGVGADGVEWLEPSQDADIAIRLINADGSEAEISGNGTRCVAAHLVASGAKGPLRILTGAGLKVCELISQHGQRYDFETAMGKAEVSKPILLQIDQREILGTPVSMGNPHLVVFVKDFSAVWQEEGAQIQHQEIFHEGVNVEFVRIAGPNRIDVRFFERGVGETQSSGTGSCASAVAAIAAGQVKSPVRVNAPGGAQEVLWNGSEVLLRGPAQIICQGEFFA
ncbi:MAG TPA: diaminopimelate epimerase [Candidatus Angelobacter sp.]|nr:diaminopimelate epimerase [Candidatus Angelobacter sp.]